MGYGRIEGVCGRLGAGDGKMKGETAGGRSSPRTYSKSGILEMDVAVHSSNRGAYLTVASLSIGVVSQPTLRAHLA